MGAPPQGWKLRPPRAACSSYTVRFRWAGEDYERSTGTQDPERAAQEAARIYARVVATRIPRDSVTATARELEELLARWLNWLEATHDAGTVETYLGYAERIWVPYFGGAHRITTDAIDRLLRERLRHVKAATVRKELSALRGFLAWASGRGVLPEIPVPGVPKRTTGTAYKKRRRAPAVELSRQEVDAILRALPQWSTSRKVDRFPIRARFVVAYETGLRPTLLDQLSVPEHYETGLEHINVTPELDKGRWARRVPLTKRCQRELDRVAPKCGLVFGRHDYRPHVRAAAADVLPPDRAKLFTGAHLRSARATHWLDAGEPITGVQFLLGHKRLETTGRYIRAAEKAASSVVKRRKR